jgi:dTDP-4-amino-4,6-dideoxygalactose transaminase
MGKKEYKVPSKDYALQYQTLLPELMPELERVLLEENPILGVSVEAFEREFAAFTGTTHAVGLNSGTDALYLALRVTGIGPGDEVITAANTFIATVSAIAMAGAKPILVDPDPETMNLSAAGVEGALTSRTAAVIPIHLYGALAPMEAIESISSPRDFMIIEDAAQAHGAKGPDGRRAGAYGKIACFSFHPSKNLGAFGDGGIITTSDDAAAERLSVLRNLGKVTKYDIQSVAPNSKLDTLQAALLRIKLKHLDAWNRRRQSIAKLYREALQGVGDLELPHDPGGQCHVYHLFVVRTARRDDLRKHLKSSGVNAGLHYPIPPHLQKLDIDFGWKKGEFPVTEECSRTVLSLPIAPELTDDQVHYACEQVRKFFASS